ncbi:VOC family protein [Devosia nitrariae]|uniref:Glyoxalase/bleomycin resistance protein n=1 Tax=Devosia nitrariae TaxID=2071872 RepID=A0ABQ5WAW1_9HYPH|nr:VOC family protein [Devosia nitrariae]GLQ57227.1 putative glyoxalase/bleomycin resistance protein [Devosia nitrariae]
MPLASGCQHIALVTADLERFISFYERVFDANTRWVLDEGQVKHAFVDLGGGFCLHPFEFGDGNPEANAKPGMFARGHIDHLSIAVSDKETLHLLRDRLMAEGVTDGTIADWGMLEQFSFLDPDGMEAEVSFPKDGTPRTFQERTTEPPPG